MATIFLCYIESTSNYFLPARPSCSNLGEAEAPVQCRRTFFRRTPFLDSLNPDNRNQIRTTVFVLSREELMDNREIAQTLKNLVLLDLEATREYDWAIDHISDEGVREQLQGFKEDHIEHADNISMYIRQLGENPPDSRELNESRLHEPSFQPGFSSDEILKILMRDEKLIAKRYEEALENVFVPEIVTDLENDFEDDQMHVESIQGILSKH